jgi:phage baseplate assembly protein W
MAENVTTLTNPSVRTINEDRDAYFGLTFPLTYKSGNVGFFPRASTVIEQASSNIKNLLLTRKGERVAQPNFGCDLWNILFEQITPDTFDNVKETIIEAMGIWLPYISVENINVFTENSNPNTIIVNLEFSVSVNDERVPESITFTFNTGQ